MEMHVTSDIFCFFELITPLHKKKTKQQTNQTKTPKKSFLWCITEYFCIGDRDDGIFLLEKRWDSSDHWTASSLR